MEVMKKTLTAKLKLLTTPDQFRAARHHARVSRWLELCQHLRLCPPENQQRQAPTKSDLCRLAHSVWFAGSDGLQRPTSGGCHLQGTVDQSQEKCRSPSFGLHQTPLQGPGQRAALRLTDAHVQS